MKGWIYACLLAIFLLAVIAVSAQDCGNFRLYQITLQDASTISGTLLSVTPSKVSIQLLDTAKQAFVLPSVLRIQIDTASTADGVAICPQQLALKNGSSYSGHLLRFENDSIWFQTEASGELRLLVDQMHWLETTGLLYTDFISGRKEAGMGHLYFCPTAFGLRKKTWEYHNTLFFYNKVDYGVNEHVSLSWSSSPFFLIIVPAVLSVKYSHRLQENVRFAVGAAGGVMAIYNFPDADEPAFIWRGLAGGFGALTLGNEDSHISLSAGAFNIDKLRWAGCAFYLKASRSVRILGEVVRYLTVDSAGIIGDVGLGFVNKNGQTFRLGCFLHMDDSGLSGFPALSLTWIF